MGSETSLNQQLLNAAAHGDDEGVDDYLGEGAEINTQNNNGETPLILAVKGDRISTVELLLEYRADIGIRDNDGGNSLDYAVGNRKILQLLRAAPDYDDTSATQSAPQSSNQEHSEEEQIKVLMMGVSGVGKTSFLVGNYGGMTEYGFQLHALVRRSTYRARRYVAATASG